MDNEKKLVQELLKSDGIDPAVISDTERAAFREMLDSEQKRIKRISWCITGMIWIFAIAMLGLCFSEKALNALHIPFAAALLIAIVAIYAAIIPLVMRLYNKLTAGKKKAIHLEKLVHGSRQSSGLVLVGIKDGKRFIHWPNVFIITVALWLIMSIGGAGVYYLLCRRWIFIESPVLYTFFCTFASLIVVIHGVRQGLKAPLEELADVKPDQYLRSKIISKLISASIIIFSCLTIWYIFLNTVESVVWADVPRKINNFQTVVCNRWERTTDIQNNIAEESDSREYVSSTYGVRIDRFKNGEPQIQTYAIPKEKTIITLIHPIKKYAKNVFPENEINQLEELDPKLVIKRLLSKGFEKLGKKIIDGVETEGVEITDPQVIRANFPIDSFRGRLWVSIKTGLPIRLESEITSKNAQLTTIMDNFEWGVELNKSVFDVNILPDYTLLE